jgi:hypothetical protein
VKMFLFVRPLCVSLSPTTVSLTAFTLWCVVQRDPFFCLRTTCANETLMALPLAYLTQQPSREGARFGATSIDATSTAIDRCKSHPPILLMALLLLGRGDGWSAQKQSCRPGQRRRPVHACAKHAVRTTQSGGAPGWPGEQSSCTHTHTSRSITRTGSPYALVVSLQTSSSARRLINTRYICLLPIHDRRKQQRFQVAAEQGRGVVLA